MRSNVKFAEVTLLLGKLSRPACGVRGTQEAGEGAVKGPEPCQEVALPLRGGLSVALSLGIS